MQHKLNKKNKGFLIVLLFALSFLGIADMFMSGKAVANNSEETKGGSNKEDVSLKETKEVAAQTEVCAQEENSDYLFVGCNGFF